MKVNSRILAAAVVVILFGGIAVSAALNMWSTSPAREPVKFAAGEFAGQANPADIRGSYFFADVEKAFGGRVAVGVAPHGSHRSGRADFPHPAPRTTGSLRDGRCCARLAPVAAGTAATADGSAPIPSWLVLTDGLASSAMHVRPREGSDSGRASYR